MPRAHTGRIDLGAPSPLEGSFAYGFEAGRADRFGNPVKPREWFLVPLPVIDEIVRRIQDHSILEYEYDRETAALQKIA